MTKFMSVEDFENWAAKHSPAEVEQAAIEQQAMLRGELLESAGTTLDEYAAAPRDGRAMMEEIGGQVWIDEDAERMATEAASSDDQAEIQTEFANRHPEHFPSEVNTQIFLDTYVEGFREAHPKIRHIFFDLNSMESVYAALVAQNAFPVSRVYKS